MSGVGSAIAIGVGTAAAGAYAANKAADAQEEAAKTASETELRMYEEGRKDTAPWRAAGANALVTLQRKIAKGPGEYTSSPGYEFRLNEGLKAIDRSAAAKGGALSGAAVKAAEKYGQDYATSDYQTYLDNYYKSLTPYQSLAGLGQTSASQTASDANQVGQNIASNTINSGNATATGYINTANAVTGAANSGINSYLMWKYLNK